MRLKLICLSLFVITLLASCSPNKPPMQSNQKTTAPMGHLTLCKNNPESIWCKK